MKRRQRSVTSEQHQRAIVAQAAAEKARVAALAAMDPEERERKLKLAKYGIDPEPPTLLQMINDYLQLVNIGGRCYVEVYAERARRRIKARRLAAGWTITGTNKYGEEIWKRPAEEEVVAAPGEV